MVTTNSVKVPSISVSSLSSPSPSASLCSSPSSFSMDDLRFFAHFLHTAYPPLPLRGDAVWQGVAALSHSYAYLVHAMLGLAASHLGLLLPGNASTLQVQNFAAQGLAHRVTAIRLLNESLSSPCTSQAEADARFAAIMSLTFQASYLPEGMFEFLSMVRGCQVVAGSAMLSGGLETGLFRMFSPEGHYETVQSLGSQQDVPITDSENVVADNHAWIEGALTSLKTLAPNCKSPMELKYLLGIEQAVRFARTSNAEAFAHFAVLYNILGEVTTEEFDNFCSPSNYVAQVLLIHFFVIEFAVGEKVLGPLMNAFLARRRIVRRWLARLVADMPVHWLTFVEWPLQWAQKIPP